MNKISLLSSLFIITFYSTFTLGQVVETDHIDRIFSEWNQSQNPGAAISIVKDGQVIFSKGYGSANLELEHPILPSTVFYIGSVSKQFVSFCILLLEEQGKLQLDDRIQKYLPDFPEYESPLTIRHFIHHTSGVRDYLSLLALKNRSYLDHIEEEEVYELIKQQKTLNFKPGEQYLYSNSCYFMLAMIVQKASGLTLREYAQKHIFKPLGMKNSLFYDNVEELIMNKASSYEQSNSGFKNLIMRFDLVGSGGIYSTVEDLYLWDQNFYHNKLGIGTQEIINKMHQEGLLNSGESAGYAFALTNGTYKGLRTVSHGGALAGYRAELMRFPDQNFSVIILANRSDANPSSKAYQLADIFLQNDFIADSTSPEEGSQEKDKYIPTHLLNHKAKVGSYELRPGQVVSVHIQSDSTFITEKWNQTSYFIKAFDETGFILPEDINVRFFFAELKDGLAQKLIVSEAGRIFTAKRILTPDLTRINIEEFEGTYYSEELNYNYIISYSDRQLTLDVGDRNPTELSITAIDQGVANGMIFLFSRNENNITGFNLDAGRVKNLYFSKK